MRVEALQRKIRTFQKKSPLSNGVQPLLRRLVYEAPRPMRLEPNIRCPARRTTFERLGHPHCRTTSARRRDVEFYFCHDRLEIGDRLRQALAQENAGAPAEQTLRLTDVGRRCFGSSSGSGRCTIFELEPVISMIVRAIFRMLNLFRVSRD